MYDFSTTVHDLIQRAYQAGSDSSRWPEFLRLLCDQLDGANASISFIDRSRLEYSVTAAVGWDPELLDLYQKEFISIDPFARATKELDVVRPGFIGLVQELISDEELAATEFYQQFGARAGYIGGIVCVVYADGPLVAILAVNRRPGRFFGQPAVELLRTLFPHVRTSLRIHRELQGRLQIGRAAIATLDRMQSSVIICDEDARVLHANRRARTANGSFVSQGRLVGSTARETSALRDAVAVVTRLKAEQSARDQVVWLDRESGHDARIAVVSQIPADDPLQLTPPISAVMIPMPSRMSDAALNQVAHVYGFTPQEARVAQALLNGDSVRGAAARLGVSYATVRSHLKRVFGKTSTSRQAELVRKLLTSVIVD